MFQLVIIDNEPAICQSLKFAFEDRYRVYPFTDPMQALPLFERTEIAFVLLDLKIGEYHGIDILERIKQISPKTIVIVITAYGSIPSSVEAMEKGAFSYATKPLHMDELESLLAKAEAYYQMSSNVEFDHWDHDVDPSFIGISPKIKETFQILERIQSIDSNVLVHGESGTGKELIAKIIHQQSKRKEKTFQTINCAAIPENLLESELFGYEKGAFTGAQQQKQGLIPAANGGTVFLDEIGEMDFNLQGKLLRVIQERKVTPVGGTSELEVDFRLIAATNRDLLEEVHKGRFRLDLYYRLNVIPIHLPPLRERKEDIPLLVDFFIRKLSQNMGKPIEGITKEALQKLEQYTYPGNVRELQNIIERAIALTQSSSIEIDDLPEEIKEQPPLSNEHTLIPVYVGETLKEIEKRVIQYNLAALNGNRKKTAQVIGIGERTLREKLKKYQSE
jgi:two-component system response regulator AtoC